jgi:uncharacterized protein (TIGR00297 family)
LAASGVALLARKAGALTSGGAKTAAAVGASGVAGTGARGAAALLTFFISSTLLGRLPSAQGRRQRRGNTRDAVQVLANGGGAAALALATAACGRDSARLLSGFGGALAAATADTWATEIGSRAGRRPRAILTGKPVPVGTSGGVSAAGLAASAAGAAAIAAVMSLNTQRIRKTDMSLARAVLCGGVGGAMADSILGAAVQEVRYCAVCGEETELLRHDCGCLTTVVRGIPGVDNDVVNLLATAVGAAAAAALSPRPPTRGASAARSTCEARRLPERPGDWRSPADQG